MVWRTNHLATLGRGFLLESLGALQFPEHILLVVLQKNQAVAP